MTREMAVQQWSRQLLQRDRHLSVAEVVDLSGGIYATAPTSYLSFVARIPGFVNDDLDNALYRERCLVRISALRGSAFLIPLDRVDAVIAASDRGDVFLPWAERIVGAGRLDGWRKEILELLRGQILPARAIRGHLGVTGSDSEALRFLLSSMCLGRELAAAAGARGWRSNQYGYARWEEWFVGYDPVSIGPDEARVEIARWYLSGHGPGTVDHFAWWAGMKASTAARVLSSFVEVDEGVYDIADPPRAVEPEGLRLLPVWDTALVAPKGRRRMVRTAHQRFVYDGSGNLTSTVVLDGGVIGVWSRGGAGELLEIRAAGFAPFTARVMRLIQAEAELLATALGVTELSVGFVAEPVDLLTAPRNRFMSPLKVS